MPIVIPHLKIAPMAADTPLMKPLPTSPEGEAQRSIAAE